MIWIESPYAVMLEVAFFIYLDSNRKVFSL